MTPEERASVAQRIANTHIITAAEAERLLLACQGDSGVVDAVCCLARAFNLKPTVVLEVLSIRARGEGGGCRIRARVEGGG